MKYLLRYLVMICLFFLRQFSLLCWYRSLNIYTCVSQPSQNCLFQSFCITMLNKYNECRYRKCKTVLQLWQANWVITSQMDPCSIIKYLLPHLSGLDWRRAAQLHTHDPAPGPALQAGDPSLSAPPHLLSSSCPAGAWQLAGGRGGCWWCGWSPGLSCCRAGGRGRTDSLHQEQDSYNPHTGTCLGWHTTAPN